MNITTLQNGSSANAKTVINALVTAINRLFNPPTALTPAATIVYDVASGVNASVTLDANATFAIPTNAQAGDRGTLSIAQDATGSRLATWAAGWRFPGGTDLVLSTGANAVDHVHWFTPDGALFFQYVAPKANAA